MGQLGVYRGCSPVADARYDPLSDQPPAAAVIEAIAEAAGVDPMQLPPLFEIIDPDALNGLFKHDGDGHDAEAIVSFTYDTWNVFVRADGRIRVCDATQPTAPTPIFEDGTA